MLLVLLYSSYLSQFYTFNPFWDASNRYVKTDENYVKYFQSLLGCFKGMERWVGLCKMRTFNPFWDASMEMDEGGKTESFTFNPFWDASFLNRYQKRCHRHLTFNPFWDASIRSGGLCAVREVSLSIPFGMLLMEQLEWGMGEMAHFQSLLGCFSVSWPFGGISFMKLSIPFGMLQSKNGQKVCCN